MDTQEERVESTRGRRLSQTIAETRHAPRRAPQLVSAVLLQAVPVLLRLPLHLDLALRPGRCCQGAQQEEECRAQQEEGCRVQPEEDCREVQVVEASIPSSPSSTGLPPELQQRQPHHRSSADPGCAAPVDLHRRHRLRSAPQVLLVTSPAEVDPLMQQLWPRF